MFRKYINISTPKFFSKIWNILKICKVVIEKHKFLTLANFTAIFLGLLPCILCLISFEPNNKLHGFFYLWPILAVYLVSILAYFIFKKFPTFSRIFSALLNTLIIVGFQMFIASFILSFAYCCDLDEKCNKAENYELALSQYPAERVAHFPKKIPAKAKNITIKASTFSVFGSQDFYLSFDIDKQYIDNEIKEHSYVNIMNYDKAREHYDFYANDIDFTKYTYYVINDREHEKLPEHHFPYHYGIGVNKDLNRILYYYENPD